MADKPISGLPALPGNLDLNALLAVVQGGITYHTKAQKLVDLTLGNIKVVENKNGVSVRLPGARVQVCWGTLTLTYYSGHILEEEWEFPQAFNSSNGLVVIPARADIPRNPNNVAAARTYALYAQRDHRQKSLVQLAGPSSGDAFKADSTIQVSLLAIGFY